MLYDPRRPVREWLLDVLSVRTWSHADGAIMLAQGSPYSVLQRLLLPAVKLIGQGWNAYHRFVR